jgi:3-oxoacyl-[acyl-carrier-protein] synthase-1
MQQAMAGLEGQIDYVNAHGTSTPAGDIQELNAMRTVFGEDAPVIGSTKSLSGHSLGAAGVQEAIYSLIMMQNDFVAASANIDTLDEGAAGMPIAMERIDQAGLNQVMSNSFGFGGTNATLILRRYSD